jgi:hypothetical protein
MIIKIIIENKILKFANEVVLILKAILKIKSKIIINAEMTIIINIIV